MSVESDTAAVAALAGVRVLDLSDGLAAYASRLLADLGAEVIRVEPPQGSPTRRAAPLLVDAEIPGASMFDRFVNAGKRSVTIDIATDEGQRILELLLADIDITVESSGPVLDDALVARVGAANPRMSRVIVSPFGMDDGRHWTSPDDLLIMAAGGLLHLGGYPDIGPVCAYGSQSHFAASIFAASAAVAALLQADITGTGEVIDVSAQECVAQALEDSAATYALTGHVRDRQGDRPREAGSGVYPCSDGHISMVAGRLGTAKAWSSLVRWLNEESDCAHELNSPQWGDFSYRQTADAIDRFTEIFGEFTRHRSKQELYAAAQARMIALSPVSTVADLLDDQQLKFRDFFVEVDDEELGRALLYPGAPYSLSSTPVLPARPAPELGQDNTAILIGELGLTDDEYVGLRERSIV